MEKKKINWDQPAPLDRWDDIIAYCKNDVLATEAVIEKMAELEEEKEKKS